MLKIGNKTKKRRKKHEESNLLLHGSVKALEPVTIAWEVSQDDRSLVTLGIIATGWKPRFQLCFQIGYVTQNLLVLTISCASLSGTTDTLEKS